ncbi:MAG: hypothetical protein NT069_01905 [Planctomycetota bacterium]|nr:hypothetical protein [Planctomycetota bacterium]
MVKKSLIGLAVVGVLGVMACGREFFSYVRTVGTEARQAMKSTVPVEFEIQRARDMVENLVPEIRTCMHVIAEEEVNIDHLNREIASAEAGLNRQKEEILALRKDLDLNKSTYQYASRKYSATEVKQDLNQRFQRFKTAEATVASKQEIRNQREKSLVAAREKLEAMLNEKRTLEVEIEHLDARVKQVQAAQTASKFSLDDSNLARARGLINELNKQLDVQTRLLDSEGKFSGLIPVDVGASVPNDLSQQIDEYFDRGGEKKAEAAPGDRVAELNGR